MSVRRSLTSLAVALIAAGCSDNIGPPGTVQRPLAQAPHFLRWAGPSAPRFSAIGARSGPVGAPTGDGVFPGSTPNGLSLVQNTATFWAVRGQERSVQINYQSGSDTTHPFLRLTVSDPTHVPLLGDLAVGDSVLITVRVDSTNIKVSLEPTGLQFGTASQLQIWYGGANGDLNGDGVADSVDARIETQLLGMWYREGADSAWAKIPAVQSLPDKSFISALLHFSDYAVSFLQDSYAVSW